MLLDATFVYTDDTIAKSADRASESRSQLLLISQTAPIALAVIGAILLIGGLVLVARAASKESSLAEARGRAGARLHDEDAADDDDDEDEHSGALSDVLPPAVAPAAGGPAGIPKGTAKKDD